MHDAQQSLGLSPRVAFRQNNRGSPNNLAEEKIRHNIISVRPPWERNMILTLRDSLLLSGIVIVPHLAVLRVPSIVGAPTVAGSWFEGITSLPSNSSHHIQNVESIPSLRVLGNDNLEPKIDSKQLCLSRFKRPCLSA